MTKRMQIERALWELNPADFQRLGETYLRRRGYAHINPIGLALGRQKTTTGTPDTLVVRDDGKYVFVEYTTQEYGVAAKFESDVEKCFDEQKTGVPVSRIAEVVLCHNGKLQAGEELTLRVLCESKGVQLTTVGLGELAADLVDKYPAIANEFLGIEVDSGQILRPEDFVRAYGRSALATPLDTRFQFREPELKSALDELAHSNILLLTGRPGVGKSRLALEAARKYAAAHAEVDVWCIFHRGADLFRELKTQFTEPGHYLLVVDDANRVSSFDDVLDLLRDSNATRTVKILATVRDYALDAIEEAAKPFGAAKPIEIGPMTTEQIHALVKQAYGIAHHLYLERIGSIAEGNPRLALMAASLAAKGGRLSSLNDATALYEEYFRSIKRDMDALGDPKVVLVAGIIAFFRNVDRTYGEQMAVVRDTFGLDPDEFWATVRRLHELEVFDLYADKVVRVSDQVLATYLFYVAAFRDESLDLSLLLTSCFPRFRQRFIEALNPAASTFDAGAINAALKPHVLRALEVFEVRGDDDSVLQLIDTFAPLIPERALAMAHVRIEGLTVEHVPFAEVSFKPSNAAPPSGSILSILRQFDHAEDAERKIALELTLAYLEKRPADAPLVVRMLIEDYGITHRSYAEGFVIQHQVAELLLAEADGGRNLIATGLLLAVAEHELRTAFHRLEPGRGLAFTSINFHVPETPELRVLRNGLWDAVFALAGEPSYRSAVLQLLRRYLGTGLGPDSKQVVVEDVARLVPFFVTQLDPADPCHALLVHEFLEMTERLEIAVDPALEQRFAGELLDLCELLTGSKAERRELGSDKYQRLRKQQLDAYAAGLDRDGVTKFLGHVERLRPAISDHVWWSASDAVMRVLRRVILHDPDVFGTVVLPRLQANRALGIEPYGLMDALIDRLGPDGALDALTAADYPRRWFWLLYYCMTLRQDGIGTRQIQMLLKGYSSAPVLDIPLGLDHLLTFQAADSTIPLQVAQILEGRLAEDTAVTRIVASFFGHVSQLGEQMSAVFKDDLALAKRLYIAVASREQGFDYDATSFDALITLDAGFAREWVGWIFTNTDWRSRHDDSRDYSRLWLRPDADAVLGSLFAGVLDGGRATFSIEPYFLVFFRVRDDHPDRADIWVRQDAWLTEMIKANCSDKETVRLLFDVVCHLPEARRQTQIATLLSCNTDFDLFLSLRLKPSSRGWSGSAVPMYEAEIDFYKSLLPLCNSAALLQHMRHLGSRIEHLERTVEQEKKRDFMRD